MKYDMELTNEKMWFTSDTHFYHTNIIRFCQRPFKTVEEMNQSLINNWNSVVGKDDIVFHLGDFVFGNTDKWDQILSQLNGRIYLILGNHDRVYMNPGHIYPNIASVRDQMIIRIDKRVVVLNHYPFLCYSGTRHRHKAYQFFGHVHSTNNNADIPDKNRLQYLLPTQYDVGVDNNNYTPISYNQIEEKITRNCHTN